LKSPGFRAAHPNHLSPQKPLTLGQNPPESAHQTIQALRIFVKSTCTYRMAPPNYHPLPFALSSKAAPTTARTFTSLPYQRIYTFSAHPHTSGRTPRHYSMPQVTFPTSPAPPKPTLSHTTTATCTKPCTPTPPFCGAFAPLHSPYIPYHQRVIHIYLAQLGQLRPNPLANQAIEGKGIQLQHLHHPAVW
jgi:hypothetical protein